MNRLKRHIGHLLIAHDCVIIPGIGAVLAHREQASFASDGSLLSAPVRAFTFNPALDHNDGVLVASIARAEGISYENAAQMVENACAQMRTALDSESRLSLGAVGMLLRNNDGSLRFIPGAVADLSPSTMWLPTVDLTAFGGNRAEYRAPHAAITRPAAPRRLFAKAAKMAAAFVVLIAVGLTLITPLKVDNPQLASLGIEYFSTKPERSVIDMPGTSSAPVVLVLEHHPDASTVVDTTKCNKESIAEAARHKNRYCLVVASLPDESEARRFIEKNREDNLGILAKDGRYRVYAVEGASVAEVNRIAADSRVGERYPNAWVCRK